MSNEYEDLISEKYFLLFDHGKSSLIHINDIEKHLPLFKNVNDKFDEFRSPRLFTPRYVRMRGPLSNYELYEPEPLNKE